METSGKIEIIRRLQEEGLALFTLTDFARLFSVESRNTLYKKIQRLEKEGIIQKIIKGKYLFLFQKPNEFAIANFLYRPSYISLESALSFYGIITGFPYQITSVTTKKTKTFVFAEKEYQYTQISQSLFWGYEKKENFLLAEKEKSLLDFLYLAFKGLRNIDPKELDLAEIDRKKLGGYFQMSRNPAFLKFAIRLIKK
jgi:predicted transcriptional regulator of viral defense system